MTYTVSVIASMRNPNSAYPNSGPLSLEIKVPDYARAVWLLGAIVELCKEAKAKEENL